MKMERMCIELNAATWADYGESPIKLFSILFRWLKRALSHVHIHKSKKKHYITFKSTKKKEEEKRLCIPSTIKQEDLFLQYSINMNIPYI
jgi:hypothetical protein